MKMPVDNTLTPVFSKPRIQALDVIRGLSILGILAVNADGYAAPIAASLNPATWLYPNTGATAISYWFMDTFFHEKFVTLFSMLFGVSIFLVGGERSDQAKSRILWRRLAALMLFALLHGFGIWWGDILSLYACAGVLMFFCRSWRPKTLTIVGLTLYMGVVISALPAHVLFQTVPETRAPARTGDNSAVVHDKKARAIAATVQEVRHSWGGAYRVNTRTYIHQLKNVPSQIPETLALMMLGLALFKTGFLSAKARTRTYQIAIAIGAGALVIVAFLLWRKDVDLTPAHGTKAAEMLLSPLASLLYASGLILILRTPAQAFAKPLSAAGRMAFTNYLTQSVIMTSIFSGGRGARMGDVNRMGLWGLVVAIWVAQLIWSPFWLSRFDMGPFEWAWRCMTYGKKVPLLKTSLKKSVNPPHASVS